MAIIVGRKPGGAGGGGAPSGPAGGDLSGTYPNPSIGNGTVDALKIDSGAASDGQVLAADGGGGVAYVTLATDGWVDDTAATWTRTANQTFTVTGDRTAVFSKGTRLKWTQTTVKFGVVVASSHAAGTTTVTIATTTDYVLTAAAITDNFYSYAANPQDYPHWFNYTPTFAGFSVDPTVSLSQFSVLGDVCSVTVNMSINGTSNATTFTLTAPIISENLVGGTGSAPAVVIDNGATGTTPGRVVIAQNTATITVQKDWAGGAWTASGGKRTTLFQLSYTI